MIISPRNLLWMNVLDASIYWLRANCAACCPIPLDCDHHFGTATNNVQQHLLWKFKKKKKNVSWGSKMWKCVKICIQLSNGIHSVRTFFCKIVKCWTHIVISFQIILKLDGAMTSTHARNKATFDAVLFECFVHTETFMWIDIVAREAKTHAPRLEKIENIFR